MRWASRAILGALAFAMTGCLIPQDDQTLVIPPRQRNRAPRIVTDQIVPAIEQRTIFLSTTPTCPNAQEFQVYVADPDVDDQLTVRWYLDNSPTNVGIVAPDTVIETNGKELRDQPATFTADLNAPSNRFITGSHLLEVIVSDGTLNNRRPLPRNTIGPDGGTIKEETFVAMWAWQVVTVSGSCGP